MNSNVAPHKIFEPYKLGSYTLKNRIMMSAMTRYRSDPETGIPPVDLYSQYYSERAESAGIVVAEPFWVHPRGQSYAGCPGIINQSQIDAWKRITDAVHKKGGIIFAQLDHGGRVCLSHVIKGQKPLGPSEIAIRGQPSDGNSEFEVPEEMQEKDIQQTIRDFGKAAKNVMEAGFDGLELHAAGGYLLDQFLRDYTNRRTDEWGGSVENRCRLTLSVLDEVIKAVGADKIGVKLSPSGRLHDMFDSDPVKLFSYLIGKIDERNIAYIQIEEEETHIRTKHEVDGIQILNNAKTFRPFFRNLLVTNRISFDEAKRRVEEGEANMVAFGRMFISNPDLVERLKNNWPLTEVNWKAFRDQGTSGFTDYKKY